MRDFAGLAHLLKLHPYDTHSLGNSFVMALLITRTLIIIRIQMGIIFDMS